MPGIISFEILKSQRRKLTAVSTPPKILFLFFFFFKPQLQFGFQLPPYKNLTLEHKKDFDFFGTGLLLGALHIRYMAADYTIAS